MFALLSVFAIFAFVSASTNNGLVQLKAFPHSKLLKDWEFGSGFYISKNYFAQQVSVAFDLESSQQLLYDANYVDINNWPKVSYHDYYRPQESTSFLTQNKTFQLKFDSDTQSLKSSVSGVWATDTVFQLFDQSSSAYPNSGFGLIQDGDSFQDPNTIFAYTGRMGMSLNGTGKSNWVIDAVKKDYEGLVTFIVVGNMFYLGLGSEASKIDNCDRTNLLTEPVSDTSSAVGKQNWQITVDGLEFGKYAFSTPQHVRFTLSSAYFFGPQLYVQKLYQMLGAYEENNQWIVDCSKQTKGPAIEFKIRNGGSLKLWPSVYVLKNTESGECYLAIREFSDSSNKNQWALGTIFTTAYCLTLDYTNQQIQFQPTTDASGIQLDASLPKASAFIQQLTQHN